MIIGIGSDIVALSRIRQLLFTKEQQFLKRILTDGEISTIQHKRLDGYVANRFAAKEAFSKALGTGIGEFVSFKDLEVVKTPQGKPYFIFSDKLKDYMDANLGANFKVHLSMSNEAEYAHATVIIESC